MYNFNYLFPVVDFEYDETMEGVLLFEDVFYGTWAMNPMYHREQRFPLSSKVVVPGCYLEWWENMFQMCIRDRGIAPMAVDKTV